MEPRLRESCLTQYLNNVYLIAGRPIPQPPLRQNTPPKLPNPKWPDVKPTPPRLEKDDATAKELEAKKEYERIKKKNQRACETPQQREARLQKMREYTARRSSAFKDSATAEEQAALRDYEKSKKKQQRANETPQQREACLQQNREYYAKINPIPNPRDKQRAAFARWDKSAPAFSGTKEYDRNQKRIQRERETPEQREERLQKAREFKATYKPKATLKEKEAAKERKDAFRANRTAEQIAKDRDAARQRMANVRSRRTVDEINEEKDKQRERRMWEPNWRCKESDRIGNLAAEERERKLASGKWRQSEKYHGCLEAIDPENLVWDCPAGPDCTCHLPKTCFKCRRTYYGCQALCPGKRCREWREQETEEPNPGTSGELYAPTVGIPEEMCEYDQIRQKNIEERQRKFQELGLNNAKTTVSITSRLTRKGK